MAGIPTGTVTFLFTDIEGSTKLARRHPETWEVARARHHAILREAIEGNKGCVFQVIGDAFCAAFDRAGDAAKAAWKAQQDLQRETWGGSAIRVRMGIHTGEAEAQDNEYQGYLTLSFVDRLMHAGHGGQILVSEAAENLLREQLPKEINLRDLGRHNLKDVPQAVRVFQVIAPDLPEEFPPLRTLDRLPNNLPTQLTSFVGREKELADVKKLLHDTHMLTLIGPGGTGKTRLSIKAASEILDEYPDGVWLVELAPILDPLLVPRTTAIAIGLRDEPQRPVIDMLCDYLREKQMLILLDNCEHLVDACAWMADKILHAASNVRILASSREALGIAGEVTYRVPSLGLPDINHIPPVESLRQCEAVKLFIDRAMNVVPTFGVTNENAPALAQICHRLDGIPLAIELAAAKVHMLSLEQIARRLDDRFRLLTGGSRTALERHQTLRATIDWSYNLLSPAEQTLFRRLAVFIGGWTLEAAESVCSDEPTSSLVRSEDVLPLLGQLINKSLVMMEEMQNGTRYRILETMRQYANEKLVDSGESDTLRDRHLEYFLSLAETAEPFLRRAEQIEWLNLLDAEHENLRVALAWALDKPSIETALRLAGALGPFWEIREYFIEGIKSLETAVHKHRDDSSIAEMAARAKALLRIAELADSLDDPHRMLISAQESLSIYQEIGDELGQAFAQAILGLSILRSFFDRDHQLRAQALLEQSKTAFQHLNHAWGQAYALEQLSIVYRTIRNMEIIDKTFQELERFSRASGDRYRIAQSLTRIASWLYYQKGIDRAEALLDESERYYKELGLQDYPMSWASRILILYFRGDLEGAKSLCRKAARQLEIIGNKIQRRTALMVLADISLNEGSFETAIDCIKKAQQISQGILAKEGNAFDLAMLGQAYYFRGDHSNAFEQLKRSLHLLMERENNESEFTVSILTRLASPILAMRPKETAQLLGAADALIQAINPIDPIFREQHERAKDIVRSRLDEVVFTTSWEMGFKMTIDAAIDLALKTVEQIEN